MRKYDFIIPCGSTCVNAHNLRVNKLQRESLPFDWIWVSGIPMLTSFFENKFQNFMLKENLVHLRGNGDADIYRDTATKTEFWHDFMIGDDFEKSYFENYNKYQRRISRMFSRIDNANSILFVHTAKIYPNKEKSEDDFMFENNIQQPEELKKQFSVLQKLYPSKKLHLLIFYLYEDEHEFKEYDISTDIHICEMQNHPKYGWKGDAQLFSQVLKNYDLTPSSKLYYFFNTLKFNSYKLFLRICAILGSKSCKQKLKKRH